ncbi:MAG TPA: beta-phosphoglucomutase family hydrolase, partial [Methanomassiliicoccaceae archaeon]|nr:beta-phosphoglucomutase family hydrolase [Methanomassiliicoccaceae archaeon]
MSTSVTVVRGIAPERPRLDLNGIDAFILDMDGVVTNTSRVHAAAWKRAFDELLRERSRSGENFTPFDERSDYLRYVDGKPRYEGAASFLASRGISLPYGDPSDGPEEHTVHGVGNRKNHYFVEHLERYGAEPYDTTVSFIRDMLSRGYRFALFTASKNAEKVLESSGLGDLFEVVVDGNDAQELGLRGKPSPDIILEAARRLGVSPDRAVVIEDALAGVEAGSAGGFATVIGADRGEQAAELKAHGADIVVRDLSELVVEGERRAERWLPSALSCSERIFRSLTGGEPAIFLDYDGTLTPIVEKPWMATMS